MILPTLKVKVNFEEDTDFDKFQNQIEQYLEDKITPELVDQLRKILFTNATSSGYSRWTEFKNNFAGLFPAALMEEFEKRRAVDKLASTVKYDNSKGEIDINTKIKDDVAKELEEDPVGYIVKSVAGLDPRKASEIWSRVLKESGKETRK